jgi:hypothetical protein
MQEKTKACLSALSAVLMKAGSRLERIVKVQIFLTDMSDFAEMNKEYETWIKHSPARSCVAVKELPKGVNIEIECIALPSTGQLLPGDWQCGCGYHNFARNGTCRSCDKPKEGKVRTVAVERQLLPGQWLCNQCGELNFVKRKSCRECGVAKNAIAEDS